MPTNRARTNPQTLALPAQGIPGMLDVETVLPPPDRAGAANAALGFLASQWLRYRALGMNQATRFTLHSLDDRTLKDIGVAPSEIDAVDYSKWGRA